MEEKDYNLWLANVSLLRLRPLILNKLLVQFGSARNIWKEGAKLKLIKEVTDAIYEEMIRLKEDRAYIKVFERAKKGGMKVVFLPDADYPEPLREIPDPPFALFYYGRLPEVDRPNIAIVGARRNSPYGKIETEKIVYTLSREGVGIISGMAMGIDGHAHRAAIGAGGYTCAVLGSGADVCYPASNIELYEALKSGGCILSEHPPETPAYPFHFPLRNRIVSGLADAVAVVEAKEKSGSLITAAIALDQGKDVFAVPGRAGDDLSRGCNELIKNGRAQLLCDAKDVLNGYGNIFVKLKLLNKLKQKGLIENEEKPYKERQSCDIRLSQFVNQNNLKGIYRHIGTEPVTIDEIIQKSGSDIDDVISKVMQLKLIGGIEECAVNTYIRSAKSCPELGDEGM